MNPSRVDVSPTSPSLIGPAPRMTLETSTDEQIDRSSGFFDSGSVVPTSGRRFVPYVQDPPTAA